MLVISVHENTKTIGEKDHCQGMDGYTSSSADYRRAIRTTLRDINDPRNEQIGRSNEQKNHKGQLHEYLTDYPNHPFCYHIFQNGESAIRQFFPIVPLPSR